MVRTRSGKNLRSVAKKRSRRAARQVKQPQVQPPVPLSPASSSSDEEQQMPVVHDPTQSLSNFIYYQKNGAEINIDVRMGSILQEQCDAIAFTVNESLSLNAALPSKVLSKTGVATAIKKDLKMIKKEKKYLAGDVAAVDLVNSDNGNGWTALMFVVTPHEPTLVEAYKNILRVSKEKMLSSIAVVGLGCGQMGISPRTSAKCFMDALMDFDNESDLDHLKVVAILDVQRDVVKTFISKLNEIVEDMKFLPDNNRKLVFVSNENLLEYEARRLTQIVKNTDVEDGDCVVCLCPLLEDGEVCSLKCDHQFHYECFKNYLKQCMTRKCCPVCRKYFSVPCGNQPANASMRVEKIKNYRLDGVDANDTLNIVYHIPSGIQDSTHLRPGLPYRGTTRYAFLPDNAEGRQVLRLLKKAFECRLIFTVGDSVTTGQQNVVTWNSIHHKTSPTGGPSHFGYPDETYFVRVRAELEEAGITEDLLTEEDQQETEFPVSNYF